LLVGVIVAGYASREAADWTEKVFAWLGSAFLFVAGVAVGRGAPEKKKDDEEGDY
jgi:arginine exporter protein ArgO